MPTAYRGGSWHYTERYVVCGMYTALDAVVATPSIENYHSHHSIFLCH